MTDTPDIVEALRAARHPPVVPTIRQRMHAYLSFEAVKHTCRDDQYNRYCARADAAEQELWAAITDATGLTAKDFREILS